MKKKLLAVIFGMILTAICLSGCGEKDWDDNRELVWDRGEVCEWKG